MSSWWRFIWTWFDWLFQRLFAPSGEWVYRYADKIRNAFKIVWCKSLNISISGIIYQLSRSRYVAGVGFRNPRWTEMKPLGVTGWFKWSSDLNDCFLWSASVRSQSANSYYSVSECVCVCVCLSSASPSVFHPSQFSSCLHVLSLSFPRCYPLCFLK